MGILNVTPDSFYAHHQDGDAIRERTRQMTEEGATILDIGACSTRPGSSPVSEAEETRRLREALAIVRSEVPHAILSVDTFRASVARMCVEEFGVQMVNDISGGTDAGMWATVAELGVPYVLTYNAPSGETTEDSFMAGLLRELGSKIEALHAMGVCDIIVDPGFGFNKTLEQNYFLMRNLNVLSELHLPLLVGVSHKRMVYELLGVTPDDALNGTSVLHTAALLKGVNILRVHEVREAMECIKITRKLTE